MLHHRKGPLPGRDPQFLVLHTCPRLAAVALLGHTEYNIKKSLKPGDYQKKHSLHTGYAIKYYFLYTTQVIIQIS